MSSKCFIFFAVCVLFVLFSRIKKVHSRETKGTRTKRDVDSTFNIPQPTTEFPLILFEGDHYNNGSAGVVHRSRPNEYRVWAQTLSNALQEFVYRSLLVLPGWKLVFQACCVAGNQWDVGVSSITNISSLHYYMFDNKNVGERIYYTQWLHWAQEFSVKVVSSGGETPNITCTQQCYFGSCGKDGHCQCKDGYSGENCEIRPVNQSVYPSLAFPLLIFPKEDFQGNPVKVSPNSYHMFAENAENKRTFQFLSARVLFTRAVTFSRNMADDQKATVSPGTDINNLESFFTSNMNIGKPLWLNYAKTIESKFYIKVEGDPTCDGCSEIGGCCYTGQCVCLPGFNGTYCSNKL